MKNEIISTAQALYKIMIVFILLLTAIVAIVFWKIYYLFISPAIFLLMTISVFRLSLVANFQNRTLTYRTLFRTRTFNLDEIADYRFFSKRFVRDNLTMNYDFLRIEKTDGKVVNLSLTLLDMRKVYQMVERLKG